MLFVCDKRTAIDVVHRRLEHLGLSHLCAVVHDAQRDQRELYRSIHKQLDGLVDARAAAGAQETLAASDRELAQLHEVLRDHERALSAPSGGEAPFHELVGRWFALPEVAGGERAITTPTPTALPPYEAALNEILERAQKEGYPDNPARDVLDIELPALLRRSTADWQEELRTLAATMQAADSAVMEGPAFAPSSAAAEEGALRTALGQRLKALLQPSGGGAALTPAQVARLAALSPAARQAMLAQLHEARPPRAATAERPLDRELLPGLRAAAGSALGQVLAWLGALQTYLEIAQRGYSFLYFGRRRDARAVLERFGLPLGAPQAERLVAFLEGVRARQLLQECRAQLLLTPAAAEELVPDQDLLEPLLAGEAVLTTLNNLAAEPALAGCAEALHGQLADVTQHGALLAGLAGAGARGQAIAQAEAALRQVGLFSGAFQTEIAAALRVGEAVAGRFVGLPPRAGSLEGVLRVERALRSLPAPLAEATRRLVLAGTGKVAGVSALRKGVLRGEILRRLERAPQLQELDGEKLRSVQERFQGLLTARHALVRDTIIDRWNARQRQRLLATTGTRLWKAGTDLKRRLTQRGARALRLRQVIDLGQAEPDGDPLFDLRPVWMASPETVAQLFPRRELFDVVIFDEASQCRLEEALPVLLRAKRVVIAGDPQQLPPTRFFESAVIESQEAEAETDQELFEAQLVETEDLLTAALNLEIERCYLDVHYRSRHESLIEFSNEHFYDARLQPIPGHPRRRPQAPPVRLLPVVGVYEKRANLPEARAVVAVLRELLALPKVPSVGIACFNLAQRDVIVNALEEAADADQAFAEQLKEARQRRGEASFEGLFVKNLESVQGDERDHIIISTTYGPDPRGRFYRRFGPLGLAGGGRRLNVLVTRAREQVHVVTSIPQEQYRRHEPLGEGLAPNGGWLLFAYLRFAEALARRGAAGAEAAAVNGLSGERHGGRRSPVAEVLAQRLGQRGVVTQVGWGNEGFWVDLVRDEATAEPVLGVLCDWTRYDKTADRIEWDLFRSAVLSEQGWRLMRVWTPQLFRDPAGALEAIAHGL